MGRIKVKLPETFCFKTTISIQISDINYGGHMGNDSYLKVAHEARIQFLNSFGWSEKDLGGYGLIMTDAVIQFMGEVFHGDQLIVEISLEDISTRALDILYQFTLASNQKVVAKLKTGMCFFDYELKKMVAVTNDLVEKLRSLHN
jgi:acyl-CoA thioesterase FadM